MDSLELLGEYIAPVCFGKRDFGLVVSRFGWLAEDAV
jgi:hypothetical protein